MPKAALTDQGYDFIIVGSGSAGSVLAERLSVNDRHRVLMLEEGPGDTWLSRMPKGYGKLTSDPRHAFFFPTSPPAGAAGPKETWVRGKMLGGSSAINGMVWIRSGREDYDRLEVLGNRSWGWSTMLPYLKKLEDHQLGGNYYRGVGGPVMVKSNPEPTRLAAAFIAAGLETGLTPKEDQNGPDLEGIGYAQWNIDTAGRRVSSARAFLEPARSRRNLVVETDVRVDQVLIENGTAVGVVAAKGGKRVEFRARREVILSAGALMSPKLLQLSGIGDASLLSGLGIKVIHDSPNVGRRLREHLTLAINYRLREWRDSQNRDFAGWRLVANVMRYAALGKGPMALGAAEAIAFVRAHPDSTRADTQIMFNPYSYDLEEQVIAFDKAPGMQCYSYNLRPESTGHALIRSSDPAAELDIDPNYLGTEHDRQTSIAGTRAIRRIMAQPAFDTLTFGEKKGTAEAQSDDEILDLYRRHGQSGYHAVGTAAMGPNEEDVVDDHLRVRGVRGLRVVDCSVFPEIPSGNTNAPTMALAWRASDLILSAED